ncbi:MAG: EAL domain-containing protein, partial [Herbaspirillum sp.]
YSSLSYLQRFSVDTLKIDQTFVASIMANNDVEVLIDSMINLGQGLGHLVIAEGIETVQQLDFLRQHGCDGGQGYYLNRAMPADEFGALLKADAAGDVPAGFLPVTSSPL